MNLGTSNFENFLNIYYKNVGEEEREREKKNILPEETPLYQSPVSICFRIPRYFRYPSFPDDYLKGTSTSPSPSIKISTFIP